MKLQDMEMFLVMVQEESLNRAAEKSYMTEAAVSQQLKKIEQELGCSLFYRSKGKKLELSEAGTSFKKTSEVILNEYHTFLNELKNNKGLQIGVSIRQAEMAVKALKSMAEDFSSLRYCFIETGHMEREEMVRTEKLDLAFTSLPVESNGLGYTIVHKIPIGVYLAKNSLLRDFSYKKAGRRYSYVAANMLNQEPLMLPGLSMPHQRTLALQILKKYQIKADIKGTFETLTYGRIVAEEGICSSISILTSDIQEIPENFYLIDGCDITYDMAVIYRRERRMDPDILKIIKHFKDYFSNARF